jgi:polyisoprenoid-binding protein YceI
MMKAILFALAALLAVTTSADAAAWKVDHTRSKLWFEGKWDNEPFTGTFHRWSANIQFDPANLAASKATVTIDLGSVVASEPDFTGGIKGPLGFAVRQFPTATFVTTAMRSRGGNSYVADGVLTIRGVSRRIALSFALDISGNTAQMSGEVMLNRTHFSVGGGSSLGMDWGSERPVAHAVRVRVDLVAAKQ